MTSTRAEYRGSAERLRVVVLGYIVRGPLGGLAWHHLQYVLGIKQLGHNVLFVEDSEDYPSCYDPSIHQVGKNPDYGLRFAKNAFTCLGLEDIWAYYDAHRKLWLGPAAGRAVEFCRDADVLINLSGVNPLRGWTEGIPVRAYIDTDPVFTQVKNLTDENTRQRLGGHTSFFTFGELIGMKESCVPDDGIRWQPTRQPIVPGAWPISKEVGRCYTTVMQWESYPAVEYEGVEYGMKRDSFSLIESLPNHVSVLLEIALGSASAPRSALQTAGWLLRDPLEVTRDPWTYQQYLQQSRGEVSVAKSGYVSARCGWFSERSCCYLFSAKPVVVQDTGFTKLLPVGLGLHAFENCEQAAAAIQRIEANYAAECRAARELAEEFFDATRVLTNLFDSLAVTRQ
jgi:hypothetical protein